MSVTVYLKPLLSAEVGNPVSFLIYESAAVFTVGFNAAIRVTDSIESR